MRQTIANQNFAKCRDLPQRPQRRASAARWEPSGWGLREVAILILSAHASDRRDLIYSMLGMINPSSRKETMREGSCPVTLSATAMMPQYRRIADSNHKNKVRLNEAFARKVIVWLREGD